MILDLVEHAVVGPPCFFLCFAFKSGPKQFALERGALLLLHAARFRPFSPTTSFCSKENLSLLDMFIHIFPGD